MACFLRAGLRSEFQRALRIHLVDWWWYGGSLEKRLLLFGTLQYRSANAICRLTYFE